MVKVDFSYLALVSTIFLATYCFCVVINTLFSTSKETVTVARWTDTVSRLSTQQLSHMSPLTPKNSKLNIPSQTFVPARLYTILRAQIVSAPVVCKNLKKILTTTSTILKRTGTAAAGPNKLACEWMTC